MRRFAIVLILALISTFTLYASPAPKNQTTSTIVYVGGEKLKFENKEVFGLKITSHKYDKDCGQGSITLAGELTTIPDYAFSNFNSLQTIMIPQGVTMIGTGAFSNCENLYLITLPDTLETIGEDAFKGCISLCDVELNDSLTEIRSSAFENCTKMESVFVSNSLTTIGSDAFKGCTAIKHVSIYDLGAWCGIHFANIEANPLHTRATLFVNGVEANDLIIPSGTTEISRYAFYNCPTIKNITIPGSVNNINKDAFKNCTNIQSVNTDNIAAWCGIHFANIEANPLHTRATLFVNGVEANDIVIPSGTTEISRYAFCNSPNIERVTLPASLVKINDDAFLDCNNIKGVYINDLEAWCKTDFTNKNSNPLQYAKELYLNGELVKEITIPESITQLKDYTFQNCNNLESITTNNSITSISKHTFSGCNNLQNITSDNRDILRSFLDVHNFARVTLGNSFTEIPERYFNECKELVMVTLPESVTKIGKDAFKGCKKLQSITIPSSVTLIESNAFTNCTSIQSVHISDLEAWLKIDFVSSQSNPLLYGKSLYINEELVTKVVVPESITKIRIYAFQGCTSLTDIVIHKNVTYVDDMAFSDCSNLRAVDCNDIETLQMVLKPCRSSIKSVTLGNGSTRIPNYLFRECRSLEEITLREGITSIGEGAFYACENLQHINIPKSVERIENQAFMYCMRLADVYIDDIAAWCNIEFGQQSSNPLSDGKNLYLKGALVTNLVIPGTVKVIKSHTFTGCRSIQSLTLQEGVEMIFDCAFKDCYSLSKVKIANSVLAICDGAFIGCKSLSNLNLGNGLKRIGPWAFSGCESLREVTIPQSVRHIDTGAFNSLYGGGNPLESITLKGSVPPSMGQNIIPGFTIVYVPRGSISRYLSSGWYTYIDNIYEN